MTNLPKFSRAPLWFLLTHNLCFVCGRDANTPANRPIQIRALAEVGIQAIICAECNKGHGLALVCLSEMVAEQIRPKELTLTTKPHSCELAITDPSAHCYHWTARGGRVYDGAFEYERQCCMCGRLSMAVPDPLKHPGIDGHGPFFVIPGGDANHARNTA